MIRELYQGLDKDLDSLKSVLNVCRKKPSLGAPDFCRQLLKAMLSMWAEDVRSIILLKFMNNFLCILDSEVLL